MEKTFVDSLTGHARSGMFRPDRPNIHAIMCALYDVNKKYGTRVTYEWAQTRVARLRERYELFSWVITREGVIWNPRLGFVTAPDQLWRTLVRQNKRARCYVNAAEELWEELCILFDRDNEERNDVIDADRFDLNVPAPAEGWVDPPPPRANENAPVAAPTILNNVDSSGSSSSSDFWAALDAYYGSDSDADSVLPVPGVPRSARTIGPAGSTSPKSPKSVDPASSSASNATPIKKEV
ncbi:hypothetical protein Salat_2880200 [Sesamum alatum]|uniref:Myb/SANT-like domain-containing protein n=1 Tax=Sesamum alatum TaxID=300844 RepID=A0AAE1XNJ4_9LAMI|nr:hypothetical protein Salat_2880200 [Sesamum alatum]